MTTGARIRHKPANLLLFIKDACQAGGLRNAFGVRLKNARDDFARQLLMDDPDATGLDPDSLIADAQRVLAAPDLAHLFTPGSLAEIGVTAEVPGLGRLNGAIDRLVITEDRILAVDYKSNRLGPDTAESVPEGLLRQMGAYAAMIREIWPDSTVETAILWTATGTLMPLPDVLITQALARASVT